MRRYDHKQIEEKWQRYWEDNGLNNFDRKDTEREVYVFDTPPPFTSGTLHMGHVLNHSWIDFVARYKRMKGYNVLLPQGFDCHGLPTELQVEKNFKIPKEKKREFREQCVKWTKERIKKMKNQLRRLGYSADWSFEYQTMSPEYIKLVQLSLLEFYKKGMIYRKEHPIHWCPKCGTALAKAELGYKEVRGFLTYIKFKVQDDWIVIATTRPEFTPACVAILVHPDDKRYEKFVGKKATVPIFNREVPIISDSEVDMTFGTGAVYLCTFGDEQDLKWQVKYNLPIILAIDKNGNMTEKAGKYKGLTIEKCREEIVKDMEKEGLIIKKEETIHRITIHAERSDCQAPIELLPTFQFFIKLKDFTGDVLKAAEKMRWTPSYMSSRVAQWAESLDWDWVISRQRAFGTPLPFWFCNCGEIVAAREEDLPVNPMTDKPPVEKCPKCGGALLGVEEVCDCWVDSSITPLVVSHWKRDADLFDRLYPTALRPQGYEIIRTWYFYTAFRCSILTGDIPFKEVLVNGMVLGENGKKMSKSLNNIVSPGEALEKYGADALRQWAACSTPGSDVPFSWKDVEYGSRFNKKLFNLSRFIKMHLEDSPGEEDIETEDIDKWLLCKLSKLVEGVSEALENNQFIAALTPIQQFVWHTLCDNYIEEVKYRLYGKKKRRSAQHTLKLVMDTILRLLAPFIPHLTEEIYKSIIRNKKSIHLETWPTLSYENPEIEAKGDVVQEIIAYIRRYKSKKSLAMNAELRKIIVCSRLELNSFAEDIKYTMNIKELQFVDRPTNEMKKIKDDLFIRIE